MENSLRKMVLEFMQSDMELAEITNNIAVQIESIYNDALENEHKVKYMESDNKGIFHEKEEILKGINFYYLVGFDSPTLKLIEIDGINADKWFETLIA